MKTYHDFFQTLHDEPSPVGYLGRGTHYSVLRALVWHDHQGQALPCSSYHDFAVIWDEDHDDRVIEAAWRIYRRGLLPCVRFIGERKGILTVLVSDELASELGVEGLDRFRSMIRPAGQSIYGDEWPCRVSAVGDPDKSIINADHRKVVQYLGTIQMLWQLGSSPSADGTQSPDTSSTTAQ
jgi:hypothetical protein